MFCEVGFFFIFLLLNETVTSVLARSQEDDVLGFFI